jgi:hypothetical protein
MYSCACSNGCCSCSTYARCNSSSTWNQKLSCWRSLRSWIN